MIMKKFLRMMMTGLLMLVCAVSYAAAYKTLSFPDDNSASNKVGGYYKTVVDGVVTEDLVWDAKIGEDTWSITNFNNNNWKDWAYIKCGSKNAPTVASIATAFAIDKAIASVVVTIDKVSTPEKINSVKLLVASDQTFSTITETVEESDITTNFKKGSYTFKINSPAANKYYKIVFDIQKTGSNGIIQISKVEYSENAAEPTPEPDVPVAKGTGTLADPFNCTAANNAAAALENKTASAEDYYIKGKVVSIKSPFSTQFGNVEFYLSDDGTANGQFYVYRALYLENKKWAGEEPNLAVGDEVVVCGKLYNYDGTLETSQNQAYVYSINGLTKPTTTVVDISNTPETAYTVAKALELITAGEGLASEVYVKGVITSVTKVSAQFGNANFFIGDAADATENLLEAYRLLNLENTKFTEETVNSIKAGDKVILKGKLMEYNGKKQIGNGFIYSLNGTTTGINTITTNDATDGVTYNLAGQRVAESYKGAVIRNGKKFIQR